MGILALLAFPLVWLLAQLAVLPGTEVNDVEAPPARSAPTDVGTGFMAGLTDRGPALVLCRSFGEFTNKLGARVSYSILADTVETFFKEGGARLWISRTLGPAAAAATHNLLDGAAGVSLTVTAISAGNWGNNLAVQVLTNTDDATIPAGSYVLQITESGNLVEKSPPLVDNNAAVGWAAGSSYVKLTLGPSANDPARAAAANLAGGNDDRNNVTDVERKAALARFTKDLGPGQVAYPGATTVTIQTALLAHADAMGRTAVLDGLDTSDHSQLVAQAIALRNLVGDRYAGLFAPWDVIPGLLTGVTRTVPPCARIMGNMARNDGMGESPNVPAAGSKGQAQYAIGLSQVAWSDADREALNDAGVNVSLIKFDGVRTYGFRTLADPVQRPQYVFLNNSRLRSALKSVYDGIAEEFEFNELDGFRRQVNRFGGQLTGATVPFWSLGSLFGATAREAFSVNVGDQVNTDETLAAGELHAQVALKMSPFAERVIIDVAKVPVTEAVA